MKLKFLILCGFVPFALFGQTNAEVRIGAVEAKDYIGKSVTVTGKVAEVYISEKVVRLNLDKPFPKQPFTAVIFATRTNLFADLGGLKSKEVEIKGTVAEYRSRPEIVVSRTNQLKVLKSGEK